MSKGYQKFILNESVFKELIARKGVPAIRMARDLGWSHTKLNWFVKGYYSPSLEDRKKIAQYLGVSDLTLLFDLRNSNSSNSIAGVDRSGDVKKNGEENEYPNAYTGIS